MIRHNASSPTGRSWERIHNYNLGVDFQLFNSRLQGTVELFMKKNNNMLIAVTYPGILGDKAPASNSGKFEAKGYEGTLTWSDKIGKVNYHIGGTFTYADNKLVDYGGVTVFKSGFIDKQQGYSLNSVFKRSREVISQCHTFQAQIITIFYRPGRTLVVIIVYRVYIRIFRITPASIFRAPYIPDRLCSRI